MTEQYRWEVKTTDSKLVLVLTGRDNEGVGIYQYIHTRNDGVQVLYGHTKGTDEVRDQVLEESKLHCFSEVQEMLRD